MFNLGFFSYVTNSHTVVLYEEKSEAVVSRFTNCIGIHNLMESCHTEPTIGMFIIKEFKRGISDSLKFEMALRLRRIGMRRVCWFENLNCDTTVRSNPKILCRLFLLLLYKQSQCPIIIAAGFLKRSAPSPPLLFFHQLQNQCGHETLMLH